MATNKERILSLLRDTSPEGLTNSDIVARAGINPHQQVFQITEALFRQGLVHGARDGKEWVFSWPPRERIGKTAGRIVNGRALVKNHQELFESCMRFLELAEGSPDERKFFRGRLKNVRRFIVVSNAEEGFNFIPGAYAAYSDSHELQEWLALGDEGCRTPGRMYLDQVLADSKIDVGNQDHNSLVEEFTKYCSARDIVPSISKDPLRFWMLSDTQGQFGPTRSSREETEYWSDEEFEAAVGAYAHMLRSGGGYTSFSKNEVLKELKAGKLKNRSETSVIYRMKNISSVLATLGKPYLAGYKPAHHVGTNGIEKIAIYLEKEGLLDFGEHVAASKPSNTGFQSGKKKNTGTTFDAWQKTLWHMVDTVKNTTENSNGQTVERTLKNKEMRLSEEELQAYVTELRETQKGRCAISDIMLHCLGEADDNECVYSLDRIDSDGHYERGNLQLVCRFINRWKSDGNDAEFRRLLNLLKN